MKVALFGGSFDPIHSQHVALILAAKASLGLDRIVVMPSFVAPHKRSGASADGADRLEMCRIALREYDFAEVSDYELRAGGTSYSYLTCRAFAQKYPDAERYFLVGADMLSNFFQWKEPADILSNVTLAACGRGEVLDGELHGAFRERFGKDFAEIPFTGEAVSSTDIRVMLAFGKQPASLDGGVYGYIRAHGLYAHPAILPALELEKAERREHSFRVAKLACRRARSLGVDEGKALLAAALHDCAKYIPSDDVRLCGCALPPGVPSPVVHQFTGAYLAEHLFGVTDEEVLDAIRYHASGRENMTLLGKLIYLADLLEEGRDFAGVEALRELFWQDLDRCLAESLRRQLVYLGEKGDPVYPLTRSTYEWIEAELTKKNRHN